MPILRPSIALFYAQIISLVNLSFYSLWKAASQVQTLLMMSPRFVSVYISGMR